MIMVISTQKKLKVIFSLYQEPNNIAQMMRKYIYHTSENYDTEKKIFMYRFS